MVVVEIPKDEKVEELLDGLIEHLKELKDETSTLKKQGFDTGMADLMMMDVHSTVNMARATYDSEDVDKAKKILADVRHELDEVKTGNEFDSALESIEKSYDYIRHGKFHEAAKVYTELKKVYSKLPEDLKKVLYKAAFDIRDKLQKPVGKKQKELS